MLEILNGLLMGNRVEDVYALVRFMYRIGNPVVNDEFYENLNAYVVKHNIATEYVNRTYDDDPIPTDLLREFNLEQYIPKFDESRSEYFRYLDEEKTLSIDSVTTYEGAFDYFNRVRGNDLMISLKVDGINSKSLILGNELKITLSRGRNGIGFDFTDNILNVLPRFYNLLGQEIKVYTEAYVESDALEKIRAKYDQESYKTEKSSAISMLRVKHEKEDYKHVKVLAHGAEGLGTKLSEIYSNLEELGIQAVPHFLVKAEEIPKEFSEFQPWLKQVFDKMFELGKDIPSDGVVVDVNDLENDYEVVNQYSFRNIALKMEYWSYDHYVAEVEDIIIEQQRVEASVRVKIKPLMAKDRTQARVINVYSPAILINNDLKVGNKLLFERNSGAINTLIHGERLQKMTFKEP